MFRESLRIIGKSKIKVATIVRKILKRLNSKTKNVIANTATEKAIPTA